MYIQVSGNTPHSSENPDWLNSSELSLKFSKKSNRRLLSKFIRTISMNFLNQWIPRTRFSGTFSTISSPGSSDGPSPVNARDDFLNESLMIRTQIRMDHLRFCLFDSAWPQMTLRFLSNLFIKQAQYPNLLFLYPGPIHSLVPMKIPIFPMNLILKSLRLKICRTKTIPMKTTLVKML